MSRRCGQQLGHRYAFSDKAADESAWLSERQRVNEHLHGLVAIAMRLQCHRLEHHDLEPFIRPTLLLHLLSPGSEYRQCRGGVSPRQVDPRLAERELMYVSQTSRRR